MTGTLVPFWLFGRSPITLMKKVMVQWVRQAYRLGGDLKALIREIEKAWL